MFRCRRIIDASSSGDKGDKGVRCMIRVGENVWGGSRDGISIEIREIKVIFLI